jgi:hypothetical protein
VDAQAHLDAWVDRAFSTALAGDGPQWDALVRELGLVPLTAEQRQAIRATGVPKLKGVLPVELRVALEKVRLQASSLPGAAAVKTELSTFVDRTLLKYVSAAQPAKAAVAGIFANAHRTAVRSSGADSVSALKCGCCGAARPAGSDLAVCTFCGNRLL